MTDQQEVKTKVEAYFQYELAMLYKVGERTFRSWIKPIKEKLGERTSQRFTPKQVQIIFDFLGEP